MRLDHFIQKLLPHDEKFYSFFEDSCRNLLRAVELLKQLAHTLPEERELVVWHIKSLEHTGDSITREILADLNKTFITPFDREDIHVLAAALDDVMDHMDDCASRFMLYKLSEYPAPMTKLTDILHRSIFELQRGVSLLRDFRKSDELQKVLEKVTENENEADTVFEKAVAVLFNQEKNPIQIIKLKEIYVSLETAIDKCEDAANVLESILIKHG